MIQECGKEPSKVNTISYQIEENAKLLDELKTKVNILNDGLKPVSSEIPIVKAIDPSAINMTPESSEISLLLRKLKHHGDEIRSLLDFVNVIVSSLQIK